MSGIESSTAAVVTLPGNYNYGNLLQKYAVQTLLKRRGICSVTLEFRDVSFGRKAKDFIRKNIQHSYVDPEALMSRERVQRFGEFSRLIDIRIVTKAQEKTVGRYSWYFSGSDQVWNPSYIDRFHSTFLPFAPTNKRIALSASFGVSSVPDSARNMFEKGLKGFTHISVREEDGAKIVKELIGKTPSVVCDPTLVLARKDWEKLASDSLNPNRSFVFTYLLGKDTPWQETLLNDVSHKWGTNGNPAPLIRISDRDDGKQVPAGPAEFLGLIASCKHVVTDSFHCALFATMFEKPLTIVRRSGGSVSMFSRLETLTTMLGTKSKILEEGGKLNFDDALNYEGVSDRVLESRANFNRFLNTSIGIDCR